MLLGVVVVGLFPTRTYLAQRASISGTQHQLDVLRAQNRALEKRAAKLKTDAEIERLAREQYNLVRPGEESYAILPPPAAPATSTTTAGGCATTTTAPADGCTP